ncbi:hypothetical protein TrVFT333_004205 [Trichoderma virens FT-333]|nr:hypothetical protein TrVFT333_004205 [Trichoderma virens FT-333]
MIAVNKKRALKRQISYSLRISSKETSAVARIVHFLRQRLVGKTIANAAAIDDSSVFGKVGTSGKEVEEALKGKTVVSAGSQGKYFWITLDKPPHLVMHFGMTENGPDPVVDKDIFTEEYLRGKMKSRHVPIKALLLDQAMISGIGNWVADETLYQAKLHPEQYSDTFDDKEIARLHESIRYVCQLAVDKLGDSDEFPDHWLFNHRWGKGGKDQATKLPNGEKLAFITVGGRTSCYAPGVQKKTGAVVAGAKAEPVKSESGKNKLAKGKAAKSEPKAEEDDEVIEEKKSKRSRKQEAVVKEEPEEADDAEPPAKKRRGKAASAAEKSKPSPVKKEAVEEDQGRRRSSRLRK